jgi:aminopeptidase N
MFKLAEQLELQFRDLYVNNNIEESGVFTAEATGRRRIKNTALEYLSRLDNPDIQQWTMTALQSANNMTDKMAALTVIVNSNHPEKEACLHDFYQQWQHEALVIDKWFVVQASSISAGTFTKVLSLMSHAAFDIKNPNRVRSLIGAFSQSNPVHFHAANGEGYAFLGEQIRTLNDINPQIAARLLTCLTTWQRYDAGRQQLMKAQLQKIMEHEAVSKDVYEVASKSLGV